MRFLMLVKHAENQGPPPKALMEAIGQLAEEDKKAGKNMVAAGGLAPTAMGARVRLSGGEIKVLDGPFTEAKEVVGGYAQFEFNTKQEAIDSALKFMELHKKHWPGWVGETEIRQMLAPGEMPKTA